MELDLFLGKGRELYLQHTICRSELPRFARTLGIGSGQNGMRDHIFARNDGVSSTSTRVDATPAMIRRKFEVRVCFYLRRKQSLMVI